ncbi:MAG: NTP transferase domain-containing protein [Theionarchaea archaeon]|nr:NTP transferase domain-containing protein [Theionarchaea archaeon]MBU7000175.1 NTP transferase domain-containing protein [Theionarchaea archaeon]MBU7020892.1 NTP transferase domain-containing protein [Theionarchaea archaeon]MBU7034979.1 NTP transferase domain-containing protein [Theionarchaea archaeon]MBU7039167.1 NTP transferase domain-containing protein [Theionarchaea archaeon]
MKLVFLAGGVGKRMFPIVKEKCLLKFLGKELILHQIDLAQESGVDDIVIVSNPENISDIKEVAGDSHDYVVQKHPLGMADALLSAKDVISGNEILVVNPNDLFDSSAYRNMFAARESESDACILGYKVQKYFPGGYLILDEGRVKGIVEKPGEGNEPSDLVNLVVHYHRDADTLLAFLEKTESAHDDVYEKALTSMIKEGFTFSPVMYDGFWTAVKYPWHIFEATRYFMDRAQPWVAETAEISEKATIKGKVIIEEDVRVFEYATVHGPAYLGPGCIIGNNSLVRDYSHIGARTVVGFSTEVKNCYIGADCWFHTNYVGDSIILDGCSFGSGTVTANFRFDEQPVKVKINSQSVETGMDKFGCIMGENCKTGINASIMPGMRIGPNSIVGSHVMVDENLEPDTMLLTRQVELKKKNKLRFAREKKLELMKKLLKDNI